MSNDRIPKEAADENPPQVQSAPRSDLPPEAQRALAEAEARRKAQTDPERPREIGGRGGPEPTRYGDWEKDGIAHDF